MAIRMMTFGDRTGPVVECDECGERIMAHGVGDHLGGGVVWRDVEGTGQATDEPPLFLCKKNRCLSRARPPWMELDTWLIFLLDNVGLRGKRLREAQKAAAIIAST